MRFTTSGFLKNKHLQTLYAPLFKKNPKLTYEEEKFVLEDNDFLDIFWYKKDLSKTVVVLLHGLDGSYRSAYIPSLMHTLAQNGFSPVLMHFRGCSGTPNNTARSYHSGDTRDLEEFLTFLKRSHVKHIFAIGFSLGANVLLKYLGETKELSSINAAIAVSPPLKLDICAQTMQRGFSRFYQFMILKNLKKMVLEKTTRFGLEKYGITKERIKKVKDFKEFDELYTAPLHGFKDANDYYRHSSSFYYLKAIPTPTLLIHAKDDPFMDLRVIPSANDISNYVRLELYDHGGHVGFVSGSLFKPIWWIDKKAVAFFKEAKASLTSTDT